MTTEAVPLSGPKANPKVALINLGEAECATLRACFREFNIQAIMLSGIGVERLKTEKFEACVLRLSEQTEPLLESLRASPLNRRAVVFGICGGTDELARFSKYGINGLLNEPLAAESVTHVLRETHLLVRGELRCYVRLPLVTEVTIAAGGETFSTVSQEISIGGMSLHMPSDRPLSERCQLSFVLPNTPKLTLNAAVCWKKPGSVGMRFDRSGEREQVRKWIENFLGIG